MQINLLDEQHIIENPYMRLNLFCNPQSAHRHTFFEFVIVTHGFCKHSLNGGNEETLPTGTLLLIRPSEYHKITFANRDTVYQDVFVSRNTMCELCNSLGENYYDELISCETPFKTNIPVNELSSLTTKFNYFNNPYVYQENDTQLSRLHRTIVAELLGKFIEQMLLSHSNAPNWLNSLYVHLTYFDYVLLPITEIIKQTGYSHGYVSTLFKKHFHESLISVHNKNKVIYSCKLLGNMKIIDIASMLGWDNPKNYAISFKRIFGCSPSEYLKKRSNNS